MAPVSASCRETDGQLRGHKASIRLQTEKIDGEKKTKTSAKGTRSSPPTPVKSESLVVNARPMMNSASDPAGSVRILSIFILPPNAIARLGGSSTPLECYVWSEDPTIAGRSQTVIEPSVSFEVVSDGSIRPYLPSSIRFRDDATIRPVAPFLELWARVLDDGIEREQPVTLGLLDRAYATMANLTFRVTAANRKAERRCGDAACSIEAQATSSGTDYARKPLLGISPNRPNSQPLVFSDKPIPLGYFQVIRPLRSTDLGIDLSMVRMRFTPAAGEVYGPPTANQAVAPGTNRNHAMVKLENRTLNPLAAWAQYDSNYDRFRNPEPSDTYDGASIDTNVSWGVVDDTCDVLVECDLVIDGLRFQAQSRIASAPPHFAPDRRPFVSLADDLKDRDQPIPDGSGPLSDGETQAELEHRINDLFQRALEVASLFNVDANRSRAIGTNDDIPQIPNAARTDSGMMTDADKPFADLSTASLQSVPHARLPLTDLVQSAHGQLADLDSMVTKLREEADRIRMIVRPPYAYLRELPNSPATEPNPHFRDPRLTRDLQYDMRMPPFMRDSDATAMSLTHRQYDELMALVALLEDKKLQLSKKVKSVAAAADSAPAVHDDTPIRRRVAEFLRSQIRAQSSAK